MRFLLLIVLGSGLASPVSASEANCRSADRVQHPCFSDALALGWQTHASNQVEPIGYLKVWTGSRGYTCIRFKDEQTGRFVEEGCELSQMNLADELKYRK